MSSSPIVEAEGLKVCFGESVALENVTFSIVAGTFTGLIGPNGAGKTTLIRTLLGLIKPTSGVARVFGHPPGRAHNLIGYVPQKPGFASGFPTTAKGVAMMGRYASIGIGRFPCKKDHDAVDEALDRVGVKNMADKKFGSLSGGEQQKFLIARALSSKPRLLLLDEPTTGVDAPSQDNFYALLNNLKTDLNITIMLVSHDIGVITNHVDGLICINRSVFCHGRPRDVLTDKLIGEAYGAKMEYIVHRSSAHGHTS